MALIPIGKGVFFDTDDFEQEDYCRFCEIEKELKSMNEIRRDTDKLKKAKLLGLYTDEKYLGLLKERSALIKNCSY